MIATHGGDVTGIARAFARDPATLLDFSANVNPSGPPPGVRAVLRAFAADPALIAAYPDPHSRALTEALARREGVAPERIVVGAGSAALLDVAVRALESRRWAVPVPAFSEYARALAAAGVVMIPLMLHASDGFAVVPVRLLETVRAAGADACILCNPHNPTGRGEPGAAIGTLVRALADMDCAAIVDEAFADYAPGCRVPLETLPERTIVLRSVTKFYAMPGLRIGYAIASPAVAMRMRSLLPSWPAGTIEQRAALAATGDAEYERESLRRNREARDALTRALSGLRVRVFAPAANFVFFDVSDRCADAVRLRDALIGAHGIVIRAFADDPELAARYVRVAVRNPDDNARLVRALEEMLDA